jgi:hypothetical protein
MAYNPNLPAGAAVAASSAPVAQATDQIADLFVTGAASQTALGNNLVLASAGAGSYDTFSASGATYRAFATQIVTTGTVSGQVIFEGSNDNTTFTGIQVLTENGFGSVPVTYAFSLSSNNNVYHSGRLPYRYFRCRISTALTGGGTAQAFTRYSVTEPAVRTVGVAQASGFNLIANVQPVAGTLYTTVSTASTNAVSASAFAKNLCSVTASNTSGTAAYVKVYNKATAPTVGTDIPVITIPVAAGATVSQDFGQSLRFATGIALAVTGGIAASDTSSGPAGVQIAVGYNG